MKTKKSVKFGKGILVLLIAVSFVAAGVVPAVAGRHGSPDGWGGKGIEERHHHRSALGIWRNRTLAQELELTDDQVTQLKDSDFTVRENQLKLKAQLDGYRLEMEKAFSGNSVDEKAVRQLAEKIADVKGDLLVQNVESRLAVGKILNADQMDKLKRHMMEKKRHNRQQRKSASYSDERPCQKRMSGTTSE